MERICPKCKEKIKSEEALFCYHCGAKLAGAEEVNKSLGVTTISQNLTNQTNKKRSNPLLKIVLFVFLVSIVLVGTAFAYKRDKKHKIEQPLVEEEKKPLEIELKNFNTNLPSSEFNYQTFSENVPVGIDVFVVLHDPSKFWKGFVEATSSASIKDITGLTAEEAASFLEDTFALIFREDSWAFLSKIKDEEFIKNKLDEIPSSKLGDIDVSLVDSFLLITNDVSLEKEIKDVRNGISLSLSKDAFFLESVKKLPNEGVALAFYRDEKKIKKYLGKIMDTKNITLKNKNAFVAVKRGTGITLIF